MRLFAKLLVATMVIWLLSVVICGLLGVSIQFPFTLIEEGEIELVKFTGDDYITLAEISKGALFGEMAIIDGSPRSGSARAKTSCVLREVSEEQLKQYLSASPQTSLDMMRRLAGYARSANEKLNRDAFESDEKEKNEQTLNLEDSQFKKEKIVN